MLNKKEMNQQLIFNEKMNPFELINKTKKLIESSNTFYNYMRGFEEDLGYSNLNAFKLPALKSKPLSDSVIINQKKSLSHSTSSFIFRKTGIIDSKLEQNDNKEVDDIKLRTSKICLKKKIIEFNNQADNLYSTFLKPSEKTMSKSSSQILKDSLTTTTKINPDLYWNNDNIFKTLSFNLGKDYSIIIKEKLINIKKSKQLENTTILHKINNEDIDYQINYTLHSFQIHMKNLNTDYKYSLKNLEINLPFSIIPVIYSLEEKELVFFISSIILLNEKFNEVFLNEEKIIEFICFYNFNEKVVKHYDYFKFDWITSHIAYEVTFKMPSVMINIVNRNIKISKYLDFELVLYLWDNDFYKWDNIIISYLNQCSTYRMFMNKGFSKLKNYSDNKKEVELDRKAGKVESYLTGDEKEYLFVYTNDNLLNIAITLKSYYCVYLDNARGKKKEYLFSLKQMGIIYKLTRVINLESFLKSLLVVSSTKPYLDLNLEFFDTIDEEFFNYFSRVNRFSNKNDINNGISKDNKYIQMTFKLPTFEIKSFKGNKMVFQENHIPERIIEQLSKNEFKKWKSILLTLKQEISNLIINREEKDVIKEKLGMLTKKNKSIKEKSDTTSKDKSKITKSYILKKSKI